MPVVSDQIAGPSPEDGTAHMRARPDLATPANGPPAAPQYELVKDHGDVLELRDASGKLYIAKTNVSDYETDMIRRASAATIPPDVDNVHIPKLVSTDITQLPAGYATNARSVIIMEKAAGTIDLQELEMARESARYRKPGMENVHITPQEFANLRVTMEALNAQGVYHTDLKNTSNILVRVDPASGKTQFDIIDWGGPVNPNMRQNDIEALTRAEARLTQTGIINESKPVITPEHTPAPLTHGTSSTPANRETYHEPAAFDPKQAIYLQTQQAGIISPHQGPRYIATDDTAGCIVVVARNTVTGEVGMTHVMVDHSRQMASSTHEMYQPMIDRLRTSPSQPLEIQMFGGLHPSQHAASGQAFNDRMMQLVNDTPNTHVLSADIGQKPHPIGVVVDVQTGEMTRTGPLVSSYEEAIHQFENRRTTGVIKTDEIPRAAPAPLGDLPPEGLVTQPKSTPTPPIQPAHTPSSEMHPDPDKLKAVQRIYGAEGPTGVTELHVHSAPTGDVIRLTFGGKLTPEEAAAHLGLAPEQVQRHLSVDASGHTTVEMHQTMLSEGFRNRQAARANAASTEHATQESHPRSPTPSEPSFVIGRTEGSSALAPQLEASPTPQSHTLTPANQNAAPNAPAVAANNDARPIPAPQSEPHVQVMNQGEVPTVPEPANSNHGKPVLTVASTNPSPAQAAPTFDPDATIKIQPSAASPAAQPPPAPAPATEAHLAPPPAPVAPSSPAAFDPEARINIKPEAAAKPAPSAPHAATPPHETPAAHAAGTSHKAGALGGAVALGMFVHSYLDDAPAPEPKTGLDHTEQAINVANGAVGIADGTANLVKAAANSNVGSAIVRNAGILAESGTMARVATVSRALPGVGTALAVGTGVIGITQGIIEGDSQKIFTSGGVTAGAMAGAQAGGLAGTFVAGPIGGVIGGTVGGIAGAAAGAALASLPTDTKHSLELLSPEGQLQFMKTLDQLPDTVKPGMSPTLQIMVTANADMNRAQAAAEKDPKNPKLAEAAQQASDVLVAKYEKLLKEPQAMVTLQAELEGKAPPAEVAPDNQLIAAAEAARAATAQLTAAGIRATDGQPQAQQFAQSQQQPQQSAARA